MKNFSSTLVILVLTTWLTACNPAVRALPSAMLLPTETLPPTATLQPSPTPTLTPSPAATSVPPTLPPSPTPTPAPQVIQHIPSPDGRWTALVNQTAGSLILESPAGETISVFPRGSTVHTVEWSSDSRQLLVVRRNWERAETGQEIQVHGPIELWQVKLADGQACPEPCRRVGSPRLVFRSPTARTESGTYVPEQAQFGQWSPDNRYVLFWHGMLSASVLADGLALWVLDTGTGQVTTLADAALLNPRYQSWAPDSAALVFTAGGYRSAQVNKWLKLFDAATGQVTTVVTKTEQIPGIVAWSPRGDLIAYAAVPADQTGPEWADWMSFENPAIAGRRVYLLDPATGEHWRLNDVEAFQDAPTWSDDGEILYYVQREDDTLVLMAADPSTSLRAGPTTGLAQVIPGTRRPAPKAVGYYGQSDWDELLAHRPDAPRAPIPELTETCTDPTHGFTLRYPAGWEVRDGWQSVHGWHEMPTLSPPGEVPRSGFGPFSGDALIAIQILEAPKGGMAMLLQEVLASAGPGQILEKDHSLTAFDRREVTVAGWPAVRLETVGDFGEVNHVLMVLDGTRAFILHGQGDGRVFDAVAGSLQLR